MGSRAQPEEKHRGGLRRGEGKQRRRTEGKKGRREGRREEKKRQIRGLVLVQSSSKDAKFY